MSSWSSVIRIGEVPQGGIERRLSAGADERVVIARALDILDLESLDADVSVQPWFDGVEVKGRWSARFGQACGVTLERLDQSLSGEFAVRVVPEDSDHAPDAAALADLDPEAPDPPDVSEDGTVDLAALVVEHFALDIDPFPRKPGAEFTSPDQGVILSPFSVLKNLRRED